MQVNSSPGRLLFEGGERLMELRRYPHFRVRFRSSFSSPHLLAGEGVVVDLSENGCKVASTVAVAKGDELELRFHSPDLPAPLIVDRVVVRWAQQGQFGLEFLQIQPAVQEQLFTFLPPSSK